MSDHVYSIDQQAPRLCGARTRSGGACQNSALPGKRRCKFHGGASTGARSEDGKARQRQGRDRYYARLRGQQGGAPRATIHARPGVASPSAAADPVERMRQDALASLPPAGSVPPAPPSAPAVPTWPISPPPEAEPWPEMVTIFDTVGNPIQVPVSPPEQRQREIDQLVKDLFASGVLPLPQPQAEPPKPTLAVDNPAPQTADISPVPPPEIVEDVNEVAEKNRAILMASMEEILSLIRDPSARQNPKLAPFFRFLASAYGISSNNEHRVGETLLQHKTESQLNYIAERAVEERRKLAERRTIEGTTAITVDSDRNDGSGDAA